MSTIKIFCEGVTDQVFIADCLEKFYGIKTERKESKKNRRRNGQSIIRLEITFNNGEIIDVGGCSKLTKRLHLENLKDNTEKKGTNLVVFDADVTGRGNNSFRSANQKLENIKTNNEVFFDHYLWPNNENDGEIEDILRKIIVSEREIIMKCIEGHQECLKSTGFKDLRQSSEKDMIRFYIYTHNIEKSESRYADYKDARLWSLNPDEIPELRKFKDFLDTYFLPSSP